MFETVLIATDGSASAERAVGVALDFAERFDASVHALYVVDAGEVASSPDEVRDDLERAMATAGGRALTFVRETAGGAEDPASGDGDVITAVRAGDPVTEICRYAHEQNVDAVITGTRGRSSPGFVLGSVAEGVIRRANPPVLTVRQGESA